MASTRRLGTAVVVLGTVLWLAWNEGNWAVKAQDPRKKEEAKKEARPAPPLVPAVQPPGPVFTGNFIARRFNFKIEPNTPIAELLPTPPKNANAVSAFNDDLTLVPEVSLYEPLDKTPKALEDTAHMMAKINHLNKNKTDAFMEALMAHRPDLAGMPFTLGDACRMKPARSAQFTQALGRVRQHMGSMVSVSVSDARNAPQRAADVFWQQFRVQATSEDHARGQSPQDDGIQGRIAALMQILGPETPEMRLGLVKYLATVSHREATRSLARLAVFSMEPEVRNAAVEALKVRRDKDYTDILLAGLRYPWPAVAERSSDAIAKLERTDLVASLVDFLGEPDPRSPTLKKVGDKEVHVGRELVRINHHRNCLMCHAPAEALTPNVTFADAQKGVVLTQPSPPPPAPAPFGGLPPTTTPAGSFPNTVFIAPISMTAQVPIPGSPLSAPSQGYDNSIPDILVRIDVTYLRQDFSLLQNVPDAAPWPTMQRFDFLVRTRTLTDEQAKAQREELQKREAQNPYRTATLAALRTLTGRNAEPTPEAWRRVLAVQ